MTLQGILPGVGWNRHFNLAKTQPGFDPRLKIALFLPGQIKGWEYLSV